MKRLGVVLVAMLLASACASAAELPAADELLEKATAVIAEAKSFEADKVETYPPQADRAVAMKRHMVFEKAEKDGRDVEKRYETSAFIVTPRGGAAVTGDEAKGVNDGTYFWFEIRKPGNRYEIVEKRDGRDAKRLSQVLVSELNAIWRDFRLAVTGEDLIDGRKMFVLEGTLEPAQLEQNHLKSCGLKAWVAQDDFLLRRTTKTRCKEDDDTPTVWNVDWLNVKINQPVDPKLFVYTPPEGVKVEDKTTPPPKPDAPKEEKK